MIKAKPWNGKDLKGTWEVTIKIDGVRALWNGKQWMSRAGKPLYNIPLPLNSGPALPADCEVYLGNFKDTIRAVRTPKPKVASGCKLKKCKATVGTDLEGPCGVTRCGWEEATPVIKPEHLYSLDPFDPRLKLEALGAGLPFEDVFTNPKAEIIRAWLRKANRRGYEGLVLRQGDTWLKVKPMETHDVLVTGAIEGVGKHKGRLGALMTAKGKVGTGFSDFDRDNIWAWYKQVGPLKGLDYAGSVTGNAGQEVYSEPLIGQTIEVSCMHFTPDGKFRHPRFVRMRPDKVASE